MNVDQRLDRLLKERAAILESQSESVPDLYREEAMLIESLGFYRERGLDDPFAATLEMRLREVTQKLDERLGPYEELLQITRLRSVRQHAAEQDPAYVAFRQRAMRNQLRIRMEAERRERTASLSDRDRLAIMERAREQRRAFMQSRPADSALMDEAIPALPAVAQGPDLTMVVAVPDVNSASATPLPSRRADTAEIGRRAREYVDLVGGVAAFTDVFAVLNEIAAATWPGSSERARVENLRYFIRRNGDRLGLTYQQGTVRRTAAPADGGGTSS